MLKALLPNRLKKNQEESLEVEVRGRVVKAPDPKKANLGKI